MSQPASERFKIKRRRQWWLVVDTEHGKISERRRTLEAAKLRARELNDADARSKPSVFDSDDIRRMEQEAAEDLAREG